MSTTSDHLQPALRFDSHLVQAFPSDFLWGAGTASYQVEGAAREDGRAPSIWDTFAATPGKVAQGDNGDVAANHYHLMQEDVNLMAELGLGAYRFSIAWPRVLPQGRGQINSRGLDFYERLVDALLAKGIQPFATLYHWDLPQALEDEGGWLKRDTAYAFADYAEIVVHRLGDRVVAWTTLNEPWCAAYQGYGSGTQAPGIQDRQAAVNAGHHILLAHGLAMPCVRAHVGPAVQVGITLNFTPTYPANEQPETRRDLELADSFNNRWFLDPLIRGQYPENLFVGLGVAAPPQRDGDFDIITTPIDFLGVNNYSRILIRGSAVQPLADQCVAVSPVPGACYTEMGWEVYPTALTDLLVRLHREYGVQRLYVTENGAAFNDLWDGGECLNDPQRVQYLHNYVSAMAQARQQGVPLCGYFVWSLLDNFEWAEGYSKRFGIVYVDYPTQRRVIKESGRWYQAFMAAHRDLASG